MKRRFLLMGLVIALLLFSMNITGLAMDNQRDRKEFVTKSDSKYTYITSVHTALSINSNGRAETFSAIDGYSNVDKVVISSYLQKYDSGWTTVKHWRETTYSDYGSMENAWYVPQGYSYRVLTYFYAYDGTEVESTSLIAYDSY